MVVFSGWVLYNSAVSFRRVWGKVVKTPIAAILVVLMPVAVCADETLYRYEGDVHPLDPSTGWGEGGQFDPCEPPCSDFIEDGHYVLVWSEALDLVGYLRKIARAPEPSPPTLWVEWRFQSNFPLGPIFIRPKTSVL